VATPTEYGSPGVYGEELSPQRVQEGLSPSKMGIVGWTDKGPTNTPTQVASIEEFRRVFGNATVKGLTPTMLRAFFGCGGEKAWVVRVAPGDATLATVGIDSSPVKWTFTANGGGVWGNNLKIRIKGNQNFLNYDTMSYDRFDLQILQPNDLDPNIDQAAETYEAIQFSDPTAFTYVTFAVNDPRKPSNLVTLIPGAGGTPSGLLSTTVQDETVGTGGGSPLTTRFTATLSQVPVLPNTLVIKSVSATLTDQLETPTTGSIDGSNKVFGFQVPLANLPVVEGSMAMYYQRPSKANELVSPNSGAIDGSNQSFVFNALNVDNAVHRETSVFRLKYGATAGASPQTLATASVLTMTLSSATGFAVGHIINDGGSNTAKVTSLVSTALTAQIISGTWAASGSVTSVNSSTTTTFTAGVTTPTAAAYNLASINLTTTPVHPGTVSIQVNVNGVGLATITDNGAGVLTGTNGSLPLNGTINYDTGVMSGITAVLTAASTVVATYNKSNVITKQAQVKLTLSSVTGTIVVGETVTVGAATGSVVSIATGQASVQVNVTSGTFAAGSAAFTTSSATATVTAVSNTNLAQGVKLIGSVDGSATNTINLVNSTTTPTGSGAITVKTNVAPLAGTNMYLDYVPLGIATSDMNGTFNGDVATNSTVDFNTGAMSLTFSEAPRSSSTIEASFQTGQLIKDNGLGALIGDVDAAGTNTVDYVLGVVDFTFTTAPPSGTTVTASYVKLAQAIQFQLAGGTDGTSVSRNDISNPNLATAKAGIYALDKVEEPLNIVVPDFEGSTSVQADIVDFCDSRKGRYGILGCATGTTVDEAIQYNLVTQAFDTKNAAFYYPNVYYLNDVTNVPEVVPCTGFVAGIYAKTARNKNVGKAPGGVVDGALDAPGIIGPEVKLELADRDKLYQARINPLFKSDATGYVVWGVRSLSKDIAWRYINHRLLNNFLFYRIGLALQWAVFENNGPALWAKVQASVDGYLASLFKLGYFAGQTKQEAYYVKCDARNNSDALIQAGQLIVDIGFAPANPAEFIRFTLQKTLVSTQTA